MDSRVTGRPRELTLRAREMLVGVHGLHEDERFEPRDRRPAWREVAPGA